MAKAMEFDGILYNVFREEDEFEAAIAATQESDQVLVARRCPKCGDFLFGRIAMKIDLEGKEVPYRLEGTPQAPVCEEGFCGNRPGVFV